ncbi:MAG: hypothetical protein JKY08_10720 [Flavobacteriaceae bacterium]|nr:hypothetical protein [Flavobacteriaceae bacterium]
MIKKTLITLITITLISCSSSFEKKYKKSTKESDLNQISELISTQDFEILSTYITELENSNSLNEKTYQTLLSEALEADYINHQKIKEEKIKEEEKIKKEKILLEKTKLLCSNKWIMKEYAFQIKIPDDSEKNIQIAKKILNSSMIFEDSKLLFSVEKNSKGIFVKGIFEDKVKKIFTGDNKRWKKYSIDGRYREQFGKESTSGLWEFIDDDKIKETRPSESGFNRNKKEFYILELTILDNQTFSFYEIEKEPLNPNSVVSTSIVMKR